MGYNTTVLILNDALDQIEKHPEVFVKGIGYTMRRGGDLQVGNHLNAAHVMRTDHADAFRLYATHQNMIIELSPWALKTEDLCARHPELMQQFVSQARGQLDALEAQLSVAAK